MKTFFRIFLVLALLALTVLFNIGLVDIRIEEINFLLGKIAAMQDVSNSLGIIGKYEIVKRRMLYGEENSSNYELEAKVQALTSGEKIAEHKNDEWKKRLYRAPVRFTLNVIRLMIGKEIVSLKEEDKILNVLEIGYFWERNRKYSEAIKVYDQVLAQQVVQPEIRAAVMIHKAFCHSMLSEYDVSKRTYERVISIYPNTEAGVLSWKLLDFIESMEKQRSELEQRNTTFYEKAKQFYLLMDYRNSIKFFSIFLQEKPADTLLYGALFYKGRSHEELGESEEAMGEYKKVMRGDLSRVWAKQANRRMLMVGEFYEQKKQISEEAKRQLALYQDQNFINKVQHYASLVSESSLRRELMGDNQQKKDAKARTSVDDSLLNLINKIGNLDLTGEKEAKRQEELVKLRDELMAKGTLSETDVKELERRRDLEENPFRRPTVLKQTIDENSSQLKYLYNRKLRQGTKLSGRMVVEITVKPDGLIRNAEIVRSGVGDKQFEDDVIKQIKTWRFKAIPENLGDLTVNYPFEFFEEE
jgi:TonB family protein